MKKLIPVCMIASLFFSCRDHGGDKTGFKKAAHLDNDGVKIVYNDAGSGDTVLCFIHGWGINKTYWDNQLDHFSKRYRVIAVDLPGFGGSGKNRNDWSVQNYGADITALMHQLDLHHVILVGHSMSGAIAVEAALRNPGRVVGVAGVDNFKEIGTPITPEIQKQLDTMYSMLRKNYKQLVRAYTLQYLFSKTTDTAVKKRVIDDMLQADSVIAVNCLQTNDRYELSDSLKKIPFPLYLVNSDVSPTDTAAFTRQGTRYVLLSVHGTGHYPMIESAAEFNDRLQEAINRMSNR